MGCRMQSLEHHFAVHPAGSASACGDMTRLAEFVTLLQRQLAYSQSALVTCEGEHDEYNRRLGVEEKRRSVLKALLCLLRSCNCKMGSGP